MTQIWSWIFFNGHEITILSWNVFFVRHEIFWSVMNSNYGHENFHRHESPLHDVMKFTPCVMNFIPYVMKQHILFWSWNISPSWITFWSWNNSPSWFTTTRHEIHSMRHEMYFLRHASSHCVQMWHESVSWMLWGWPSLLAQFHYCLHDTTGFRHNTNVCSLSHFLLAFFYARNSFLYSASLHPWA